MRIIARRTLREFIAARAGHKDQPALKAVLDAWFEEVRKARWTHAAHVKRRYATASVVTADKGNSYRLVVSVDFEKSIVWITRRLAFPPTCLSGPRAGTRRPER
jgi:mRNA interferase HigB